jgi:hypothetical protein
LIHFKDVLMEATLLYTQLNGSERRVNLSIHKERRRKTEKAKHRKVINGERRKQIKERNRGKRDRGEPRRSIGKK